MTNFRGTYDQRTIIKRRQGLTIRQIAQLSGLPQSVVRDRFRLGRNGVSQTYAGRLVVSRVVVLDWLRRRADSLENAIFILATEVDYE